jgi:Mce-associated membrane protein
VVVDADIGTQLGIATDAESEDRPPCHGDDDRDDDPEAMQPDDDGESQASGRDRWSPLRLALSAVIVAILALGGLATWWSYQAVQAQHVVQQRQMFLAAGRQAALNLTSIDYTQVDADIKRVLDSSTGSFYDEFQKNSQGFGDVVKNAKSKTEGSITAAGIESISGDTAQILVSLSVKTTDAGAPEQQPRLWRMRITIQRGPNGAKASNVGFVP